MRGHSLRFGLPPLGALLCVGACLSTEGYYRPDGGASGAAGDGAAGNGAMGTAGTGGGSGSAGTTGAAGNATTGTGGQTAGTGGGPTGIAGRGGTTGAAGSAAGRGGTTGAAGRGGTTGTAGAGSVLFTDDFETGTDGWDFTLTAPHSVMSEAGNMILNLSETAGDQALAAVGSPTWTNFSVEARVKVTSFGGTSSSDGVAICARLGGVESFYYFAIQANDMKGKIKINNGSNSSLSSSFDAGFTMNTWLTMRLDVQGSAAGVTLTAYVNGTMRNSYVVPASETDKILTMGGTGFMVQRANAVFDDITVRALP